MHFHLSSLLSPQNPSTIQSTEWAIGNDHKVHNCTVGLIPGKRFLVSRRPNTKYSFCTCTLEKIGYHGRRITKRLNSWSRSSIRASWRTYMYAEKTLAFMLQPYRVIMPHLLSSIPTLSMVIAVWHTHALMIIFVFTSVTLFLMGNSQISQLRNAGSAQCRWSSPPSQ